MAWIHFPLPTDHAGWARVPDAYNELRTAIAERDGNTPVEMKSGMRLSWSAIENVKSAIVGMLGGSYYKINSFANNSWDIRQYSTLATQAQSCPDMGRQNVFEDVFGAGVTTWPTATQSSRKAAWDKYTSTLNECYQVLDKLRIRRHSLLNAGLANQSKTVHTYDPMTWSGLKSAINAASWESGSGYASNRCTYQYTASYEGGIKFAGIQRGMNWFQFNPLLNTQPVSAYMTAYSTYYSQYFSSSFDVSVDFRTDKNVSPPSTVTGARGWGTSLATKSFSGGLTPEYYYSAFTLAGASMSPGETRYLVAVLNSSHDTFEAWSLPPPPNNDSEEDGWGDAYCDTQGAPYAAHPILFVNYAFDKMS